MITKTNMLNHELIGLKAEVIGSKIKGVIVDETQNTFIIRSNNKEKKVLKKGHEFRIELEAGDYLLRGDNVMQRPYERLRKKYKVKTKWEETLE